MNTIQRALAASAILAMGLPVAAVAQEQELVVTAPAGLPAPQDEEWARLNAQAKKIEKRLKSLRKEMRDDVSDVKEARNRFEKAEKKLASEQKDYDKTAGRLAEAEKEVARITDRRAELRAVLN